MGNPDPNTSMGLATIMLSTHDALAAPLGTEGCSWRVGRPREGTSGLPSPALGGLDDGGRAMSLALGTASCSYS